ncbi:zeaxanthin epoxidase, chloroplastic-like [Prunus avium]|uniref:Zeaxanthin epoxidase, chloroplastic-like n=1 Tax=Prunus avium TaxID=42229 RepID=A0A6P5S4Z9_PRUAV|nr:zeaxanthin epoxidase, chloroplastic-like [Prunus avium]
MHGSGSKTGEPDVVFTSKNNALVSQPSGSGSSVVSPHRLTSVEKDKLKCDHCGDKSHTINTCWALHGIPDWKKEWRRLKREQLGSKAHVADTTTHIAVATSRHGDLAAAPALAMTTTSGTSQSFAPPPSPGNSSPLPPALQALLVILQLCTPLSDVHMRINSSLTFDTILHNHQTSKAYSIRNGPTMFTKFDLSSPPVSRGLPITRVICRMELQDILVNAVGSDIVRNNSKVVDFIEEPSKVTVILEDGQQYHGDVLVGADGIWSKVRSKLFGRQEAKYSNYTCYSGMTKFVPPYIDSVGYRIFLGLNQYFVALNVGNGNMQWFAFHKQPPMSSDPPEGKKKKLLEEIFGKWCDEVVALIEETPESMILQRDIYDRDMIYAWGIGRVALLGDAAHPLQPNLGQGGCMAIEDCYQLIHELDQVPNTSSDAICLALRRYAKKRIRRVGIVHAATRIASELLAMYQPCIHANKFKTGHMAHLSTLQITNPAFRMGQAFLQYLLPEFMTWLIAGHGLSLKSQRERERERERERKGSKTNLDDFSVRIEVDNLPT